MRWQDGYPCDSGSTDGQDSARLIGIMALFEYSVNVYSLADKISLLLIGEL